MTSLAAKVDTIRRIRDARMLAHLGGKKRRVYKRLPKQVQPDSIRRTYFAALKRTILKAMWSATERHILPKLPALVAHFEPAHRLDEEGNAAALVGVSEEAVSEEWTDDNFSDVARPVAEVTSDFQKQQLQNQLKAGMGVDVLKAEPWLEKTVDAFVAENVALIKSIPSQYFSDVEKVLTRGIADGKRPEELQEDIQDRFNVSESRAALIARDQVGKFFGDLNAKRQAALGINAYVWRTSRDERVREEHAMREGERFEWASPPEDGNPGEPVNCRCSAEPDLSGLLEDLEE